MKKLISLVLVVTLPLSGCATMVRKSADYDQTIKEIKTIAVMPPDVEVYRLTAGGMRELIDEWSDTSKQLIKDSLKKYLEGKYGFQIKFIDEDWLKENYKELWNDNRALYNAVSISAIMHAYPSETRFPTKVKNFDYTLGSEVGKLAKVCEADALLFTYGYDHEATVGRNILWAWNFLLGVYTGIMILPTNPSGFFMGLVDANTGDIAFFKATRSNAEYSFIRANHIDLLIKWMTKDFIPEK